jgi:hypothetical protein
MLAQFKQISNADLNEYYIDRDEYDRPDLKLKPLADAICTVSGNRVSLLRKRRSNSKSYGSQRRREAIGHFSKSSGYRMAKYLRECEAVYTVLATLTFDNCPTPIEANAAFQKFLKRLKRFFKGFQDFSAFWFREFQKRGSIHYHFFSTHYIPQKWLSQAWLECNPTLKSCQTNIKTIGSGRYGTGKYALKYANKQKQKKLPNNLQFAGRWWGKIGKTTVAAATIKIGFDELECPVLGGKVAKLANFVTKCEENGFCYRREVTKMDTDTNERVPVGITLWEFTAGYKLRTLINLFNELIDDPEKRLKHQRGWICGKQVRQNSKIRPQKPPIF